MLAGWSTGYTIATIFMVVLIISLVVASGRGDTEIHRRRPKDGRRVTWREAAAARREEKQQEREEKRREKDAVLALKKVEGKQDLPQN